MLKLIAAVFLCAVSLFAADFEKFAQAANSGKTLSAEDAASRESALQSDPENALARAELLGYYSKGQTPEAKANRLRHITWIIENHPESPLANLGVAMVSSNDIADYQQVKDLWLRAADKYSNDARVLVNAARLVGATDHAAALKLLKQAVAADPNGPAAGDLGGQLAFAVRAGDADARRELEACAPAAMCGGGGMVLANIFMMPRGEFREFGLQLLSRAVSLDPQNPKWAQMLENARNQQTPRTGVSDAPGTIRVDGQVQQANIVKSVAPEYPALAKQARLQGVVRFSVVINKDGSIKNMQLISGHPLLIQAAQDALKQWVYRPTLLNGEPVEVNTTVDIKFSLAAEAQ
jgi:TonB family protein